MNLGDTLINHSLKFFCTIRRTIGHPSFRLRPEKLNRIKLWGVLGKPLHMKPPAACDKSLDHASLMNESPVPQQNDMFSEVKKEITQEISHIHGLEVLSLQMEIQRQVSLFGRNSKRRNRRSTIPSVKVAHDRCLALRSPSAAYVGKKQKTAFIQKDQMGAKCERFFLSPANSSSSTVRLPLRPSPEPAVPASGSSIPTPSELARYDWDDTGYQKSCGSPQPPDVWSRCSSDTQKPKVLPAESLPVSAFVFWRAWEGDLRQGWDSIPLRPFVGRFAAIGIRNLRMTSLSWPPPPNSCPGLATGWLFCGVFPVAEGFLEVSCSPV